MAAKERAMKLLGQGVEQEVVATALGVSPGYVSQLLSDPEFAKAVTELRLRNLESATDRDSKYDELEDELLEKLKQTADYMTKPREIAGVLASLNKATRRGVRPENAPHVKQDVVVLTFPTVIQQKFVTNHNNTVIAVGTVGLEAVRDLTTITAKNLLDKIGNIPKPKQIELQPSEVIEHGHVRREEIAEGVGR